MKLKGVKNFIYSGLAALTLLTSCEEPDSDYAPQTEKPAPIIEEPSKDNSIYDNVYILKNSDLEKVIYSDDETVGFSSPQNYSVGDVIVSGISESTPYGILGEITYATPDKKSFKLDKNTSLDKVLVEGEGSIQKTFNPNDIMWASVSQISSPKSTNANYNFHVDFDEIIYDEDGNFLTTDDQITLKGYSDFNIFLDSYIGKKKDERLNVKVALGLEGKSKIELNISQKLLNLHGEIPLQEYYFDPIVFTVGPAPVVILPRAKIKLNYDINADSQMEFGLLNSFNSRNILELKNGEWTFSKHPDNYFKTTIAEPNLDFNANVSVSLAPEVAAMFYGIAGFYGDVKFGTTFDANTKENPWWNWNAWINADIGLDVSKLTNSAKNFEKIFTLLEDKLIAQAEGAFPGNEIFTKLDSLIIQPGSEGKDAWLNAGKISNPECTKTSSYSNAYPDDAMMESSLQYTAGCGFAEDRLFIQFPLNVLPQDAEITSAKLSLYGHTSAIGPNKPIFYFNKIEGPWNEQNITWENQPQTNLIGKIEFSDGETQWNPVDVTSTVKRWISGEPNYGFEISSEEGSEGKFYSSNNADPDKRPKLVIYYQRQNE